VLVSLQRFQMLTSSLPAARADGRWESEAHEPPRCRTMTRAAAWGRADALQAHTNNGGVMNLIISIIIGGIIGWLASIIMKTDMQMGLIANILVGIVGSALGFWLAGVLGIAPAGGVLGFLVGVAGAVLLIFILGKLGIFKKAA
jgi:uncharacterized membrane protein YeaQ/YmgE (transglycosylase-associated protein family)